MLENNNYYEIEIFRKRIDTKVVIIKSQVDYRNYRNEEVFLETLVKQGDLSLEDALRVLSVYPVKKEDLKEKEMICSKKYQAMDQNTKNLMNLYKMKSLEKETDTLEKQVNYYSLTCFLTRKEVREIAVKTKLDYYQCEEDLFLQELVKQGELSEDEAEHIIDISGIDEKTYFFDKEKNMVVHSYPSYPIVG